MCWVVLDTVIPSTEVHVGGKTLSSVCQIPKHRVLCYRNKQSFFIGDDKLVVMVPILVSVFEPIVI